MHVETHLESQRRTLLVVDADDVLRTCLLRAFRARGFYAHGAASAKQARTLALEHSPDYALLDIAVDGQGLQLAQELSMLAATTRIVIFTGPLAALWPYTSLSRAQLVRWLMKPADVDQIIAAFDSHAADVR